METTKRSKGAVRGFLVRLVFCVTLALALGSCGGTRVEQQVPLGAASFRPLAADTQLGQTFVVHHDGLAGVAVFLRPDTPGAGTLRAELLPARGAPPVATASLAVAAVNEPRPYELVFAEPLASRQRDYFLVLQIEGEGMLQLAVMPGTSYRDGSLYLGAEPIDGQLVHGQIFATGPRLLGFLQRLVTYGGLLLAAAALLLLPGLGLLAALGLPGVQRTTGEWVALAVGVSLALLPVVLVWARVAGLQLGPWNAWLPIVVGAVLVGLRFLVTRRRLQQAQTMADNPGQLRQEQPAAVGWRFELGLLGLVLVILLVRLVVVGSLEAPMWGDSYQHAMITQLILDNNGIFSSWAPYEPYETLTVQFGFSAFAAVLAWVTGLDAVDATLTAGQILNAAAALVLYPFALRLANGNRWAGVVAVSVAGLLTPLPGVYVNWGRYAQLSGQVVLPIAMTLTWDFVAAERRSWRPALLLGLVVAGMALCYYRMAFFYAAFVAVLLVFWAVPTWRLRWRQWLAGLAWLGLAGASTVLFFAPWAINVATSQLAATMGEAAVLGTPLEYIRSDYAAWRLFGDYMPFALLIAAAAAVVWALFRRAWMLPGLALWTALLAGYMATSLFGVPGAVMLQSFSVMIATYIPVALACGWLAAALQERIVGAASSPRVAQPLRRAAPAALPLVLVVLAGWGAVQQLRIVDPMHILVTRPDVKAMRWIAASTPPDARFLVQGFDVYGGTTVVGADGGWWIPLLAGRANTMPPQYALANERPEPLNYTQRLVELVHTLKATPPSTEAGLRTLCSYGITHLYNGQGQGGVGVTARSLWTPAELDASPYFVRTYAEDRVTIYRFDRQRCSAAAQSELATP